MPAGGEMLGAQVQAAGLETTTPRVPSDRRMRLKGSLKRGVDRQSAIDVLWLFMAPDQLRRMRLRGWDDSTYEAWLADVFVGLLLP